MEGKETVLLLSSRLSILGHCADRDMGGYRNVKGQIDFGGILRCVAGSNVQTFKSSRILTFMEVRTRNDSCGCEVVVELARQRSASWAMARSDDALNPSLNKISVLGPILRLGTDNICSEYLNKFLPWEMTWVFRYML